MLEIMRGELGCSHTQALFQMFEPGTSESLDFQRSKTFDKTAFGECNSCKTAMEKTCHIKDYCYENCRQQKVKASRTCILDGSRVEK